MQSLVTQGELRSPTQRAHQYASIPGHFYESLIIPDVPHLVPSFFRHSKLTSCEILQRLGHATARINHADNYSD